MDSFVYRWREKSTGKWYIGYHKGTATDGYVCSSRLVKPLIQANPAGWTRRILRSGTHEEMIKLERRLLARLSARQNPKSYNQHNGNGHTGTGRPQVTICTIKLIQAIETATGHSYWQLLVEDYTKAIMSQDKKLKKQYETMLQRLVTERSKT